MLVLSVRPPLLPKTSSSHRLSLTSSSGELSSCDDLSLTAPEHVSTTITEGLFLTVESNFSLTSMAKPYSYVTSSSNAFHMSSSKGSYLSSEVVKPSFMTGFKESLISYNQIMSCGMPSNEGSTENPTYKRSSLLSLCEESTCIPPSGDSTGDLTLEEPCVPQSSDGSPMICSSAKSTPSSTQDCHQRLQSKEPSSHSLTKKSSLITSLGMFTLIPPTKKKLSTQ